MFREVRVMIKMGMGGSDVVIRDVGEFSLGSDSRRAGREKGKNLVDVSAEIPIAGLYLVERCAFLPRPRGSRRQKYAHPQ